MRPTFVLVPGAGGHAGYWHLVVQRLHAEGFGAVAVDLPGPDPDADLARYVEIVVEVVRAVDGPVVLVAQSMGGLSASWAATVVAVEELVLLNAMVPVPQERGRDWWAAVGQGEAMRASDLAAGRDPDAGFDLHTYFLHDVPLEALAGLGEERDESDAAFDQPWAPLAWPDVPVRVLVGGDDRLFPPDFQERVAWDRLHQDVERIPGGHLAALGRPDAVTAALIGPYRREHRQAP